MPITDLFDTNDLLKISNEWYDLFDIRNKM